MKRLLVLMTIVALPALSTAQVPMELGYQGRLLLADGTPASGVVDITFALFDVEEGGGALWSEVQQVALTDGFYATYLGSVVALPVEIFDGRVLYLELVINGEALLPRQRVASVAYALKAAEATNLLGGVVDATSIRVNGQDVTVGGVTDVTASAPISSSGGTTPNISLPQASSAADGHLSAADWTMFNDKLSSVVSNLPLGGAGTAGSPLSITQSSGVTDGFLGAGDWNLFNSKVSSVSAGTGSVIGGTATDPTVSVAYGDTAGTAAQGNDPRLSDARVPLPGSNDYIQNQTVAAQAASFDIGGNAHIGGNVGIGTQTPGSELTVVGLVESTFGGFKFPDSTVQTTAAPRIYRSSTMATMGSTSRTQIPGVGIDFTANAGTPLTIALYAHQRCSDSHFYNDVELDGVRVATAGTKAHITWRVNNHILWNGAVNSTGTHTIRAFWEGGTACNSNSGEMGAGGANVSLTAWVGP